MTNYDVIIIGGSAAGVTAAITARKYYPDKSILLVRDEELVPIPCGIPYVYGTVLDPMKNLIPVNNMMTASKIEMVIESVVKINREFHLIFTESDQSFHYEKLVIATGSNPIIPKIEGIQLKNVFSIKKNTIYLKEIQTQISNSKKIVIIGAGFIGAEMAEECKKFNPEIEINVFEMQDHPLKFVYDTDLCILAEKALVDQGINLHMNENVVKIIGNEFVEAVETASKKRVEADMVILGIGATPNTKLAHSSGLELGPMHGILVNRYMQTIDESIFACGDCADKVSFFDCKPSGLRLASIATMEARIVGANLFDVRRTNYGVVGCFSTVLNHKAFAGAGLTVASATEKGFQICVGEAESVNRHPGIMPGGDLLKVKLVFERSAGRILGGQAYGALSAGELINAISAFVSAKMTAEAIATFQAGTHPALTASPIAYQLVNAAENAIIKMHH